MASRLKSIIARMPIPLIAIPWMASLLMMTGLLVMAGLLGVPGSDEHKTGPVLKNGSEKWRIAYYEGGRWSHYPINLRLIIQGLMEMGWINKAEIPFFQPDGDNRPFWRWLGQPGRSDYLEFDQRAYWSADWNDQIRVLTREDCVRRLQRGDLDLMLALGTWAGVDIANNRHSVPTVVTSATDPVASGIVKGERYSGIDHVVAKVEPHTYERQIHLAFDILGFNTVGVVYDSNDPNGRVLAHLEFLESVAAKRGFRVMTCNARDVNVAPEVAVREYQECARRLAPDIDLFYLSDHQGTYAPFLLDTLQPLYERGIPAWSGRGAPLVEAGALMSIFREEKKLARFLPEVVAGILNGARPGSLDQRVEKDLELAINRAVADMIGYKIPKNLERVAARVYDGINRNPRYP